MPKVSKDSAPQRQEAGPVVDLRDELDGYTVTFTSLLEDIDATPFMMGLPDDRCQCPHWGYVFKGKMTARYADRDEVFEVGDAFYTPPGHVPVKNEPGTEFVSFSPSEELRTAEAVMMKNMQAMQDGSTPLARRLGAKPLLGRRPCCIENTPAAATRRSACIAA
jgi:hypothetical protein